MSAVYCFNSLKQQLAKPLVVNTEAYQGVVMRMYLNKELMNIFLLVFGHHVRILQFTKLLALSCPHRI